jgi:hypothetical protein
MADAEDGSRGAIPAVGKKQTQRQQTVSDTVRKTASHAPWTGTERRKTA